MKTKILQLKINEIQPNPTSIRQNFRHMGNLVESIKRYGIFEPLQVMRIEDSFHIVDGHRRYRDAETVGLKTLPVIVREFENTVAAQLVFDIQKLKLSQVERKKAILELTAQKLSVREIAELTGIPKTTVHRAIKQTIESSQLPMQNKSIVSNQDSYLEARFAYPTDNMQNLCVQLRSHFDSILASVGIGLHDIYGANAVSDIFNSMQKKLLEVFDDENNHKSIS